MCKTYEIRLLRRISLIRSSGFVLEEEVDMYMNRNHASDSVIGERIRQLVAEGLESYKIANQLISEGYEVVPDESGLVRIKRGTEVCHYPLGVTSLPTIDSGVTSSGLL